MEEKLKLNVKMTIYISLALVIWGAFSEIFNSTLQSILVDRLGNSETFKGTIMSLSNVLALVLFPLFGVLSDKTKSKYGKRTPYIVGGGLLTILSMMCALVFANLNSTAGYSTCIVVALFALSIYRPAANAILPDLTPKPLNSEANALKGIVLALGAFVVTALILIFGKNFTVVYSGTAAFMLLSLIIFAIFVNENKLLHSQKDLLNKYNRIDDSSHKGKFKISTMPKEKKLSFLLLLGAITFSFLSYYAVMSTYVNYADKVWGMAYNKTSIFILLIGIAGLIAAYPVTALAKRIGRKSTLVIGLGFLLAGYGLAAFMTKFSFVTIIAYLLIGLGWSVFSIISTPMLLELSDVTTVGAFVSLYTVCCTVGRIIAPLLTGLLIDNTKHGYATLYPTAAASVGLAILCLVFVKHGNVAIVDTSKELARAEV